MLKHASICRTNRAQQTLRAHWDEQLAGGAISQQQQQHSTGDSQDDLNSETNNNNPLSPSLIDSIWFAKVASSSDIGLGGSSCSSSPVPSTPLTRIPSLSSAPPSVFNSPSKSHSSLSGATTHIQQSSANRNSTVSTIKIFAQTLSQEVEYVTLHVNAQTKSQQIIRSLLKKFRLKHRDPNLFYLTLERWIRKDGLKFKSVMLLGDDACPLQLQQCCSSPPHNDIKFALQVRTGALIKVFCSDVCQTTKYKCLSLSAQTTVDETIELMLHCLNLTHPSDNRHATTTTTTNEPFSRTLSTPTSATMTNHVRQASSPSSSGTSNSSASSTSSSSGIESDLTNQTTTCRTSATQLISNDHSNRILDSNSRSSSVTSISSSSNMSHTSSSLSSSDNYCLVIECENSNYKRILESNEHLVDVYQGLLDEAQDRFDQISTISSDASTKTMTTNRSTSSCSIETSSNKQPDQWFVIKLKRREDMSHPEIKFTNPRQNMPLPPIPLSLAQFNNVDNIQKIVSTTQIEVNNHHLQRRPSNCNSSVSSSNHTASNATIARVNSNSISNSTIKSSVGTMMAFDTLDGHFPPQPMATASSRPINCHHQKQMSAIVSSNCNKMPPPPASLIWLPPIKPRRSRNLSNASSTFGRPLIGSSLTTSSTFSSCNRRRYDPAQLAEDLNRLDMTIGKGIDEAELHANKINESSQGGGGGGGLLSTRHEQEKVIATAAAATATKSGTPVDDTIS